MDKVFTIRPKKWWWKFWPPKKRLIRNVERWMNSPEMEKLVIEEMAIMVGDETIFGGKNG